MESLSWLRLPPEDDATPTPAQALIAYNKLKKRYVKAVEVLQASLEHNSLLSEQITRLNSELEEIMSRKQQETTQTFVAMAEGMLERRVHTLEQEVESQRRANGALEASMKETRQRLEQERGAALQRIRAMTEQVNNASAVEAKLNAAMAEITELKQKCDELCTDANPVISKLQLEVSQLKAMVVELEGTVLLRTEERNIAIERNEQLQADNAAQSSTLQSLQESFGSDSKFREFMQLKATNTALREEVKQLKSALHSPHNSLSPSPSSAGALTPTKVSLRLSQVAEHTNQALSSGSPRLWSAAHSSGNVSTLGKASPRLHLAARLISDTHGRCYDYTSGLKVPQHSHSPHRDSITSIISPVQTPLNSPTNNSVQAKTAVIGNTTAHSNADSSVFSFSEASSSVQGGSVMMLTPIRKHESGGVTPTVSTSIGRKRSKSPQRLRSQSSSEPMLTPPEQRPIIKTLPSLSTPTVTAPVTVSVTNTSPSSPVLRALSSPTLPQLHSPSLNNPSQSL